MKKTEGFVKSDNPKWEEIRDQLRMSANQMKKLAERMVDASGRPLSEEDKNLVASAYAPHVAAVTNSLKVNIITRDRDRSVDDIEEIHRIQKILDCL